MKNFNRVANGLIIIFFILILISIYKNIGNNVSLVHNGLLDVRRISSEGPKNLTGQWYFYWNQLIDANGLIPNPNTSQRVKVPSSWINYEFGSQHKRLPLDGYGIYRVTLQGSPGEILALKIPQIGTSYNLWIDSKLVYSSGKVGKTPEQSKPKWTTKVVNFEVKNQYTDIMFEVSNFHYFRSGITTPIIVGTQNQVQNLKYKGLFLDTFMFAALAVMSIFFILLYLFNINNKSYIYLALYAGSMCLRPLLYGECYFNEIFPNINFELNTKIYIVNFIGIQLFFLYFYHQYEGLLGSKISNIFGICVIGIILLGVVLPVKYMIYPIVILEILIIIMFALCLYLLYLAHKKNYNGIMTNLLSVLLLVFLAFIDILNNNRVIQVNMYYSPIAIFIITFIQTFLQVCKFKESSLLNEKLTHEIDIRNLKLEYEIKQRNLTEKLNAGLKAMVSTLKIEELLTNMMDNLFQIIKFESASITFIVDESNSFVLTKSQYGETKLIKYTKKFYMETLNEKLEFLKLKSANDKERYLIIKRVYYKGEILSVLKIILDNCESSDLQLIEIYSEQMMLTLQNAKSYKVIKELAMYDELTTLYNRRYFMKLGAEDLKRAKEEGTEYGVIMLDIDHFKKINDTYGHLFGDKVLKNISRLCKEAIPSVATIGRYGGEEFIIFIKGMGLEEILEFCVILKDSIENYCHYYNEKVVRVTISMGISMAFFKEKYYEKDQGENPEKQEDLKALIENADKALYKAKNSGRNSIKVYNLIN